MGDGLREDCFILPHTPLSLIASYKSASSDLLHRHMAAGMGHAVMFIYEHQFGLMLFHFGFIKLPKSGDDDKITHASTTRRAAVE